MSEVDRTILRRHRREIKSRDERLAHCSFVRSAVGLPSSPGGGPPILPDCYIIAASFTGTRWNVSFLWCGGDDSEGSNATVPPCPVPRSRYVATGSTMPDAAAVKAMLDEARAYWAAMRQALAPVKRTLWQKLRGAK